MIRTFLQNEMNGIVQKLEGHFRAIMENTGNATLIVDEDTTILLVNEKFESFSGYLKEELEGKKSWTEFFSKEDLDRMKEYHRLRRIDPKAAPRTYESRFLDRYGNYRNIFLTVDIIPGTNKSIGSLMDITPSKETEISLQFYKEQLQSLMTQLTLVEEKERKRISEELHEHVGNNLACCKLKLETLRETSSSSEYTKSINEAIEHLEQAIKYSRALTFEISSPILYELGLDSAVMWLGEQILRPRDIQLEFEDDMATKQLSEDVRIILFNSVRELFLNIAKHAYARKVKVSMRKNGDYFRIIVEDDGVGFDTVSLKYPKLTGGLGLFSIGETLKYLGGSLEIKSKPGSGTQITIATPLKLETKN